MWWKSLLKSIRNRRNRHPRRAWINAASFGPAIEALETRSLLSVSFQAGSVLPAGGTPVFVATGDFNRDGALDLATVTGSDSLGVRLGNGDGTFGSLSSYSAGLDLTSVAAGDFNGDARLDLAAVDLQGGALQLLLGNGDGTFQAPLTYDAGQPSTSLAVADFNSDGHLDLAVVNSSWDNSVSVLLNDGSGGFLAPVSYGVGIGPTGLAVGDFNGDNKPDLAVASPFSSNTISVLLNDGSGGFQAAVGFSMGNSPQALVVGDFNGDGKADLAGVGGSVGVLLGNGDGTFAAPAYFSTAYPIPSLAVGDFNLDGRQDLAAGYEFSVETQYSSELTLVDTYVGVTFLEGRGDGTFANGVDVSADHLTYQPSDSGYNGLATSLAVGDFDGNGGLDVAAGSTLGNVAILINNNSVPPVAALALSDASVKEGNSGTTNALFTVSLSAPSTAPVTVHYATADGTATAGSDYRATSGTLTFAPGELSKTIAVQVIGDRRAEANETFSVNLDGATNSAISDGNALGTIVDDEPRISISDVSLKEGAHGQQTQFVFTVTLSAAYDQSVTMSFRTVNGTATTSDNDYVAKTGTITFNPGETSKTITIVVNGDNKREANETFYLDLFGNSSNSLFSRSRGVGTILNDD